MTKKGIPGVYVILKDSNNKELQRATTDDTGHYQFNNLQNGTYNVEFVILIITLHLHQIQLIMILLIRMVKDGDSNVVVAKGTINNV